MAMQVREFDDLKTEHGLIGIANADVYDGIRVVPEGWRLHWSTNFWLPPTYIEHPYGEETQHTLH